MIQHSLKVKYIIHSYIWLASTEVMGNTSQELGDGFSAGCYVLAQVVETVLKFSVDLFGALLGSDATVILQHHSGDTGTLSLKNFD